MLNILTSDMLIMDIITPLADSPELAALAAEFGLTPGGKKALTKEQHDRFAGALRGKPMTCLPGGSSANTLTTLSRLLGDEVSITFISVLGEDTYSAMIRKEMEETHIQVIPNHTGRDVKPEIAISFVLLYPSGERTIATYSGSIREILKAPLVTPELIAKQDVLFVQGKMWESLDPQFSDAILIERWENWKRNNTMQDLWMALPTRAKFGVQEGDKFQWLSASANVILSNHIELCRVYHVVDEHKKEEDLTPEERMEGLKRLQENAFRSKTSLAMPNSISGHRPVGYITCGKEGAYIVTADEITPYPAPSVDKVVSTLGAGDTSYAGFLLGYVKGLEHDVSVGLASALACAKLSQNGPRLQDPRTALKEHAPHLFDAAFRDAIASPDPYILVTR